MTENLAFKVTSKRVTDIPTSKHPNTQINLLNTPVLTDVSVEKGSKHICQSLRKYPLATADIFLFNLGKSKKNFENVNYEMLETLMHLQRNMTVKN